MPEFIRHLEVTSDERGYFFRVLNVGILLPSSIESILITESFRMPDSFELLVKFWKSQNAILVGRLFSVFINIDLSEMMNHTVKAILPRLRSHLFLTLLNEAMENEFTQKIRETLPLMMT